jgi:carbon starvation protein
MLENETHARFIGYGGMLMESFVAIMALISACILQPGGYFAMNSPPAVIGMTPESAAQVISSWGFVITPELLTQTAEDVGELSILSRTGGAPTLAVGMAKIMADLFGSKAMMAFWYHFAILFEALFILTAIDAGTRVGRFMIQDLLGTFYAPLKQTQSWASNLIATTLCVGAWGYFLYQGVIDPLGGINTLWPLFGISNQMLAAIALTLGTVVLFKMKRERYAWVTIAPAIWLVICTLTAGLQKLFHPDPAISFLASARRFSDALAQGQVLAPAKNVAEMERIIFNSYVDAGLCALFIAVVAAMVIYGLKAAWGGYVTPHITAREAPAHV